jgi:Inovirus Coat protein B
MFKRVASAGSLALFSLGQAYAAVPTDVTGALDDMKADGLIVAGAVLVAIIAIAAVKFIRKGL